MVVLGRGGCLGSLLFCLVLAVVVVAVVVVFLVVVGGSRRTAVPPATGRVALETTDGRVAAVAVWAAAFSAVQSPVV